MNRWKKIMLTLMTVALTVVSVFYFLEGVNWGDRKFQERKLKIDFLNEKQNPDDVSVLMISASPTYTVEPGISNWTVSWSASPTYVSSNSWIASYFYAQSSLSQDYKTYFNVDKTNAGRNDLRVPQEAGIYDIKYIQDNNRQTIASTGPLVVNPSDVVLELKNTDLNIGENISVAWSVGVKSQGKLNRKNSETYLCLNVVGSYDKCLWKKKIGDNGKENVNGLKHAGYFVMRIITITQTWKFLPDTECVAVSSIFRISDSKFSMNFDPTEAIVASTLRASWNTETADYNDWIGLYSLETSDIFIKSAAPLYSINLESKNSGEFYARLPPNSPAGPYIFIYFSNLVPVAVSDIVNVQQPKVTCLNEKQTMSKIKHLVIICTENHSFDSYFGNYCSSEVNSNPTCNHGPECCERAPDELDGYPPQILDDDQNMAYDPNHGYSCELCEVNGGKMDGFVNGCFCSNPINFVVPDLITLSPLHKYARKYALADRFFQPAVGASAENDMYLARASYVFEDNTKIPVGTVGSNCWYLVHGIPSEYTMYYDPSITSLLAKCDFQLKTYAEGYKNASLSFDKNQCYPDGYDPTDIPYNYYAGVTDNAKHITDYLDFVEDLRNGTLPDVSFIKPLGTRTAHPGSGTITDEINFIKSTVNAVFNSTYGEDTLILWVPDESGGFYDHVTTPETSKVDNVPYGPRIPFLAIGHFAKKNYISHVEMEHSSIVKFIEWNWLGGQTGQLNTRDKYVNNIGDLIDPIKAGTVVPSN